MDWLWFFIVYLGIGALLLWLVARRQEVQSKPGTDPSSRWLAMIALVLIWPLFFANAVYHAIRK